MGIPRTESAYLKTVVFLLFLVASFKLITAATPGVARTPFWISADPIFYFFSNRTVLILAGVLELLAGGAIVYSRLSSERGLYMTLWLGTLFSLYRGGLWLVHYDGPCKCLGDVLGGSLANHTVNTITLGLLVYLIVPPVIFLAARPTYGEAPLGSSARPHNSFPEV